jgi:hypothetical protein
MHSLFSSVDIYIETDSRNMRCEDVGLYKWGNKDVYNIWYGNPY